MRPVAAPRATRGVVKEAAFQGQGWAKAQSAPGVVPPPTRFSARSLHVASALSADRRRRQANECRHLVGIPWH